MLLDTVGPFVRVASWYWLVMLSSELKEMAQLDVRLLSVRLGGQLASAVKYEWVLAARRPLLLPLHPPAPG